MMKKFLSYLLVIALFITLTPFYSYAEEITDESSLDTVIVQNGTDVTIGSLYGEDEKLWLRFAPCGPNNLMQLYTISKSEAESETPETLWLSSGTDWVGPVQMKERGSDDDTTIYSGGWHAREDKSPSAKTESIVVKIDGEEQTGSKTTKGSKVEIIVTNELYVGIDEASSSSGMREVVRYEISGNVINVETTLTALSDVTITQYFGLQAVTRTYTADMIQFINGQEDSAIGGYYTHGSGTKENYPDVNAVVHSNESGDIMTMTLDRTVGLGNLEYLKKENHIATHSSMNKSYFNLVNGIVCDVDKGESLSWKGQYEFEKLPASENVIADYNELTRDDLVSETFTDATISNNLTLPTEGSNGSKIIWESDDEETISSTGVVKIPYITKSVNLKATIYDGKGASMEKHFSFRVNGEEGSIGVNTNTILPERETLIREEKFDDDTIDAQTITNVLGNVKEENGGLHLIRRGEDGDVYATIYMQSDKQPVYGTSILEIDISKKDTYTGVASYIYGANGLLAKIQLIANKQVVISYGDGSGGEKKIELGQSEVKTDTLNFKFVLNSGKGTFRLWMNDEFICEEKIISATTGVSRVDFLQGKASGLNTDVVIENIAISSAATNGFVKFVDNFDDGILAENITVLNAGTTTVKEEDGVLKVATSSGSSSSAAIYLNKDKTAVKGKFSLEFQISRTACKDAFDFYIQGSTGAMYAYGRLWNGDFSGYWADSLSGEKIAHTKNSSNDKMGVYLEINTVTKQIDAWINGVYQGSGYSIKGIDDVASVEFAAFATDCDPVVEYFKFTDLTGDLENSVVKYDDSFEGGLVSNNINIDNMEQKDGSINVVDRTKVSKANFYMNEDKSAATGDFTVEFTASRNLTYATTDFHFYGADNKRYTTIRWWSMGNSDSVYVMYRDSKEATGTTSVYKLNSVMNSRTKVHVKVSFNTEKETFSVWINDVEVIKDAVALESGKSVAYLSMENVYEANGSYAGTGYADASMHDILYYSRLPKGEITQIAADYNAYDKKISIVSHENIDANVFAASYCGDKMLSAAIDEVTLKKNDDVLADTSLLNVQGAEYVNIYIWGENIIPICEKIEVKGMLDAN